MSVKQKLVLKSYSNFGASLHFATPEIFGAPKLTKDLALSASTVFALHNSVTITATSRVPNQALKLTEIAVDENAARPSADTEICADTSAQ
jgi:hypothetical protein